MGTPILQTGSVLSESATISSFEIDCSVFRTIKEHPVTVHGFASNTIIEASDNIVERIPKEIQFC